MISWEESGHDFDARETEALIAAIYELYGLTPDEIKIVEGGRQARGRNEQG